MVVTGGNSFMETPGDSAILPDLDFSNTELTESQLNALKNLLGAYKHVFAEKGGAMGRASFVKHSIRTKGPPIHQPPRRIPVALQGAVKAEVKEMLNQGVIQPSSSPWSSPVVMVKKKNGSWRFCIDFRKVNAITHKDAYPLPCIDATLDSLCGSSYFTTLDLASGYWQIEMDEVDKEKTAFSTPQGHFEFNVMPFGLTNAPATFQRLMECALAGLSPEQCLIYLDDIIVFGKSFEQHLNRLEKVFKHLAKVGLKLRTNKCCFAQKQVHYLGYIVSSKGIHTDPAKLSAVTKCPTPRNIKQLRHFLGLTNYYRKFIQGYSHIAEPLHKLTRKTSNEFCWNDNCQEAFELLKQRLTSAPILAFPNFEIPFIVYTDASEYAMGAVLSQVQEGRERVIAYWSRQLRKAERNYSTIEREALAVVGAVKEFYPYLYGFPFELVTDHNPLTSLKSLKDTGGRIARWLLFLQQFSYAFRYKPGKSLGNADALSRIPTSSMDSLPPSDGAPKDTVNETAAVVNNVWCLEHPDKISKAQHDDTYLSTVIKAVELGEPPPGLTRQTDRIFLKNGILCRTFRESTMAPKIIQILVPIDCRQTILQQLHDSAGHLGVKKTLGKVKERYYWPGYEADVKKWVRECRQCQQSNPPNPKPQAPLRTITANYPFQKLSMDIMGPLPKTDKGNKYILVVTDLFSKWTEAFPLVATDAETIARILVDEVICRFGVPSSLHSDQGANLCGEIISSLCQILGIDKTRTSAYHPQGNAQVERFNRTLEAMLSKIVLSHQRDWDCHLSQVLFAYRTAIHEVTGFTPYLVTFGRSPNLPVDVMFGRITGEEEGKRLPEYINKVKHMLNEAYDTIRQNIKLSHKRNKSRYDKKGNDCSFNVGDRVWLYTPAVKVGRTKKLASLWRGPYTVLDKTSTVNYRIQLIGSSRPPMVVHRNRLKLCYGEPVIPNRIRRPQEVSQTPQETGSPPSTNLTPCDPVPAVSNPPAGYTTSEDPRPQRDRRPPDRYGNPVPH